MGSPSSTTSNATAADPPKKTGRELLCEWVESSGRSIKDAAIKCGQDPAQFSRFMRGLRRPGLDAANKMSEGSDGAVPVGSWPFVPRKNAKRRPVPPLQAMTSEPIRSTG